MNYINSTPANVGATVWVYGTNFNENTYVTLDGTNIPIWPNNAPARGTGVLSFNIPSGVSSGTYTVQVGEKGSSFPLSNSVSLTI
ncbi:MAG: hypothetical protein COV08_00485 [Candidatus Vogelbacteria bacterium CG10_big_fil_rev_8_21_14_0_10_49_38]|uniref:IPT/TIG domain-containing protein n=1 Tax=Candidatus Vogelbacteria bacterium CG10_big_fil_rev_8_21_14_0_10_49_38 TaxID=1975043 RepID=A0A2H0RKT0_9BACT|nr:MAG: hypothetical protein COV08_00485 [Candidatus Vogelbacteria bacterium CG10_big_fil_rev_8_21_14_0_10_49_38]